MDVEASELNVPKAYQPMSADKLAMLTWQQVLLVAKQIKLLPPIVMEQ